MKVILIAISAVILFAFQNITLQEKLSKYNPLAIITIFYSIGLVVIILQTATIKANGGNIQFPPWNVILTYGAAATLCAYLGQFLLTYAYTSGGTAVTITTIVILLPVFVSIIQLPISKSLPTLNQVIGYCFAVVSIMFLMKK